MTIQKNSFGQYVRDPVRRVCRMIGYTLTILDEPAMWQLSAILHCRLSPDERAFLSIAALWSLDDEEYAAVIEHMEADE